MPKHRKIITEYRNYSLPMNFPVFHLTGDKWKISDIKSGRLHFHNCLEIGICHSHSGIMEFEGESIPFQEGDITCVPRNLPHTTYSTPGTESRWSYIFVDPEELFRDLFRDSTRELKIAMSFIQKFKHVMNKIDHPKVHFLTTCILDELEEKKANYQTSVKGLLLSLCIEFLRIQSEEKQTNDDEQPENSLVISPALDYIHENYMAQFTIEDLADLCHLSVTHFRRLFVSIMGTSPLDFINNTRIYQACILLRSTEEPILSISEKVGFHSISSFNRYFSKVMHISPREWRVKMIQYESKGPKPIILEFNGWILPPKHI
jgi:AraC-like DNA-binding protein